jgi:cell wall-associated NlpC family hydrolase
MIPAENFALDHLGKPWASGEAGPLAFDCWGLVRTYYQDVLGVALPIVDVDALAPLAVRREFSDEAHRSGWEEISGLDDHAAVLMSKNSRPSHVGIALRGGILHSVEGVGVCYQSPLSLRLAGWNIIGTYRRAA